MKIIKYEELRVLKESDKSSVRLVREVVSGQLFVEKKLKGQQSIYLELQKYPHAGLPRLYDVKLTDDATIVMEEYIDGQSLGSEALSEKQTLHAIKELCTVLEFLHEKDIIHRDIKPSNIILAKDGHIRLIDFDAARKPKDDLEQDTRLLGTRGYAPPEQYGFSQTDARADIYSLGVTLEQLLGEKSHTTHYRRIIGKCTNLNPDKRYQSARQVKRAFYSREQFAIAAVIACFLLAVLWHYVPFYEPVQQENQMNEVELVTLPAPENPHWNGESGIALWGNVPESGNDGEVEYEWRLYYSEDEANPPDITTSAWRRDGISGSGWDRKLLLANFEQNLGTQLEKNGYYYFSVCAIGDGIKYADSPYVMSDAFKYTGEDAPQMPKPTGLAWKLIEDDGRQHFATWSNLDEYLDTDSFNVRVYNQDGMQIHNNLWKKEDILSIGNGGIWIDADFFEGKGNAFRFTVEAQTSRPNEYSSVPLPQPVPEEYYSPWCYIDSQ